MAEKPVHRSEADAVADLADKANNFPFVHETDDGRLLAMLPIGGGHWEMKDVSDPLRVTEKPPHIRQQVIVQTLDSLVDYGNRFKTGNTLLFADIEKNAIRAVIDYHAPPTTISSDGETPLQGDAEADRLSHHATMVLPFSVEWKTWTAIDGKLMGQLEFARFLEENAADIIAPSGADLLEACRDLQAARKVNFIKAVRTNSDNENFEFTDETTATSRRGDLEVPTKFTLSIPIYFGESGVTLNAFLRWRLEEGEGLKLGIQLHRAEHVRQAVFKQIVMGAAERLERTAMFGQLVSPPGPQGY